MGNAITIPHEGTELLPTKQPALGVINCINRTLVHALCLFGKGPVSLHAASKRTFFVIQFVCFHFKFNRGESNH